MDERSQRKMVQRIAMSYLGTFYIWGGDDPSGFDCSGLAIECLKSVGVLPREGDWTAQDLSAMFPRVDPPQGGDLVFWTSLQGSSHVVHVEICLSEELSIGASGGGSKTKTIKDAIKQNAFIKIRPIHSRKNVWGYVNPYMIVR
jgi:cell wall-associated NlpC family hydrolase